MISTPAAQSSFITNSFQSKIFIQLPCLPAKHCQFFSMLHALQEKGAVIKYISFMPPVHNCKKTASWLENLSFVDKIMVFYNQGRRAMIFKMAAFMSTLAGIFWHQLRLFLAQLTKELKGLFLYRWRQQQFNALAKFEFCGGATTYVEFTSDKANGNQNSHHIDTAKTISLKMFDDWRILWFQYADGKYQVRRVTSSC